MFMEEHSEEVAAGITYEDGVMQVILILGGNMAKVTPEGALYLAQRLAAFSQEAMALQTQMNGMSEEVRESFLKDWIKRTAAESN